ncbi:cytoplasmic protein [Rhodotorula diobovata]|uniref:Cytoplasmic protein n=1 Tax=Rhodotorula diobovata TaxID=5288 RepID=A0A5C5FXS2_9BASI|nr:cytoplasmic protein [Rhodotorula diobovata]
MPTRSTPPAAATHPSLAASYRCGSSGSPAASLASTSVGPAPLDASKGRFFLDSYGRRVLLHGANVSGLDKLPTEPNGFTHLDMGEAYFDGANISFVGRPWPLEESHEHLSRLRNWGLTFIRLVVPWEALEHRGPGEHDQAYIAYLHALISLLPQYGIRCYIDAHQDVWSRHAGGSGAPLWTLTLVGFDVRNLKATGAAHAHNLHLEPHDPPPNVWPSGVTKLAAATTATVFWGGDVFAPKRRVRRRLHKGEWGQGGNEGEEVGLQEFLQESMCEAFGVLADRLRELEGVMGFEVMNEPHKGYIELLSPYAWDFTADLAIGYFPSAVQSWALGCGHSVLIPHYAPSFPVTAVTHHVLLRPPQERSAWLTPSSLDFVALPTTTTGCIWAEHGVWQFDPQRGEVGEGVVLKQEYFRRFPEDVELKGCIEMEGGKDGRNGRRKQGEEISWYRDFYFPFVRKFSARIRRAPNPSSWLTFVEPMPNEFCPSYPTTSRPSNMVYAPHWYDLQTLFEKKLGFMTANVQGLSRGMFLLKALYFGRNGLKKNYALQISTILQHAYRQLGETPVVLGETGVPFDLNDKMAFETGDFAWQERMLDGICAAIGEAGLSNFNLWNYNPLNNDEWGDSWNGENFSWFSLSDVSPAALKAAEDGGEAARLNVGARVLDAVQRPYACKTAGIPLRTSFDMHTRRFTLSYINPIPPSSPLAAHVPPHVQAEATPGAPPLVGEECRARETEVFLPARRYGAAAREGRLRVEMRDGDGEWRYDEEIQTLYVLHANTTPGFVHTLRVSVSGPADRPALRRWYEPPAWLLSFLATGLDAVWVHLLVVVTVGGYMGWWLVGQAWRGEGFAEGWWAIGGDVKSFEEL